MTRFLIAFLICCVVKISAQEIKGHVFDSKTKQPIAGASVYYDGSSIGTITDVEGNFTIGLFHQNNAVLVIRHLGYSTKKIQNPKQDTELGIGLSEDAEKLNEIVLTSDPFSRKQKMRVFKLEFLGDTRGGRNSTIENEHDIKLYFNTYDNTLSAYCEKPVIVRNEYLGYVIDFDIEEFKIYFKRKTLDRIDNIYHTAYQGSTRFQDVSAGNPKMVERRKKSYLGSKMHFVRSCWDGDLLNQSFTLKKGFKPTPMGEFFETESVAGGLKNVRFKDDKFIIYHKRKNTYRSTLKINKLDTIYSLDRYGNCTPYQDLVFGGYMADFRIGEMLPIDYGL